MGARLVPFVIAALALCFGAAACAPYGAERALVERFFAASRLRDRTALRQIATTIFEPREQGTVTDFTIVAVTDPETSGGGVVSKRVTVTAPVRLPDGRTAPRRIVLLLQKRDRWIVTGFAVS